MSRRRRSPSRVATHDVARRRAIGGVVHDPVGYRKRSHVFSRSKPVLWPWFAAAGTALVVLGLGLLGWKLTAQEAAESVARAETARGSVSTAAAASTEPTPVPAATAPSDSPTITIAAVGDMMFERSVKTFVKARGGAAAFSDVATRLAEADLAVGNLETPLSDRGTKAPNKGYTFQGTPLGADGLASAGFDFVSMANNHVLDFGPDALADTFTGLDAKGIAHAGAGTDRAAAWAPAVLDVRGRKVACLSFSDIVPPAFAATADHPGIADSRDTMDEVLAAVKAADATSDYVLVSFHWGDEYQYDANAGQVKDAHRLIDAGADMVLAHHPHVIQGLERYKSGLIAYSLGDFVFDHDLRSTGEAFILEADLGPTGVGETTCTPIYCSDTNGRPEYVHGREASVILKRLRSISDDLGQTVTIVGDVAKVPL